MHTLFTAIRRLHVWLSEVEDRSKPALGSRDWADLPPHHPNAG